MSLEWIPLSALRGQEAALRLLSSLADLPPGEPVPPLLLHGPEGVGKRTAALGLAAALACRARRPGEDPCGRCTGCARVAAADGVTALREGAATSREAPRVYPDIGLVSVPRGRTRISILQARDVILSARERPFELARRVYVIEPADLLTNEAANSLLKILEEPPPTTALVLVTSAPWSLPVTVRSRLQPVRFRALPTPVIREILAERGVPPGEAERRAALAGGSVARALALDPEAHAADRDAWLEILERLAREPSRAAALAVVAGDRWGGSTEEAEAALSLLLALLRDLAALAEDAPPADTVAGERLAPLAPVAARLLGPAFERTVRLDTLRRELATIHRNPRLALEGAVLLVAGHPVLG